ncbi:MAG: outer membrane beta-barrel protein [Nitrospiraceae bacterium]
MCHHRLIAWACWFSVILFAWSVQEVRAEREWEFSIAGYGGKAFHSNEDMKINSGDNGDPFHGTIHRVNLNDSGAWGAKISAWHLPKKYDWQPQVGFELDYSRFTADLHPQRAPASGTVSQPGFELAGVIFTSGRDVSIQNLTVNMLFRYALAATPQLPQGRLSPYIGGGVGVQRAHLTDPSSGGFQETDYAPALQGIAGVKFFLTRNLALFTEYKRIWSRLTFDYSPTITPPGYSERWTVSTNLISAGAALHF